MQLIELSDQQQQAIDQFTMVCTQHIKQFIQQPDQQHWINLDNVNQHCRQVLIGRLSNEFPLYLLKVIGDRLFVAGPQYDVNGVNIA